MESIRLELPLENIIKIPVEKTDIAPAVFFLHGIVLVCRPQFLYNLTAGLGVNLILITFLNCQTQTR